MPLAAQAQYRVSIAGSQPEQKSHADIQALVDADTVNISVMSLDQTSGWQAPNAFWIVKTVPNTPTAPAALSAAAAPTASTVPATKQSKKPHPLVTVFHKSSAVADKLLSWFSDNLARKLAKMAGQPDPITGEKAPKPHPAPQVASETPAPAATPETTPPTS